MAALPESLLGAVEGITDESLLRRICTHVGVRLEAVYGKNGKSGVLQRLDGFNNSARYRHWVVLVDLDHDAECAPPAVQRWLNRPARLMCFRVAVRAAEAWLLADRERVARFIGVRTELIPDNPDELLRPKEALVNLARQSRNGDIREDMVPRIGSGQAVGPAYASRIIEFVEDVEHGWRPEDAANRSESLRRTLAAIRALVSLPFRE